MRTWRGSESRHQFREQVAVRKKLASWSAPIGQCWRVPPSWAACKLSAADTLTGSLARKQHGSGPRAGVLSACREQRTYRVNRADPWPSYSCTCLKYLTKTTECICSLGRIVNSGFTYYSVRVLKRYVVMDVRFAQLSFGVPCMSSLSASKPSPRKGPSRRTRQHCPRARQTSLIPRCARTMV
jgi:hypothetical protein